MSGTSANQLLNLFLKCGKVSTDTRQIEEGSIFFALKGANFNGNTFAETAINQGAAYVVVDELAYTKSDKRYILVDDVLTSLQILARDYRKLFLIPIIGLTGSNGKTTSKELIAAVLSKRFRTHFTKGNFNNHIGVPLTLLQLKPDAEVAVIEMGANHQKEIEQLCNIALPTHGLITNIGRAHLEGFGGIEGVQKGKGELLEFLKATQGTFFLNTNDPRLIQMTSDYSKVVSYGINEEILDDFYYSQLQAVDPFIRMEFKDENLKQFNLSTQIEGRYNAYNIAAAVAIGNYFKVDPRDIKSGIESYIPANNRSQLIQFNDAELMLDAYNANPDSMRASIQSFLERNDEPKLLILGDMKELGEYSLEAHQHLVDWLTALKVEVVLVGDQFGLVKRPNHFGYFETNVGAKNWFLSQDLSGKSILLKGSRSIGLEKLVQ
jgi:UDP-N-acetylmuramoyl-tripeptide--D-alanyl-D-alanine ligase